MLLQLLSCVRRHSILVALKCAQSESQYAGTAAQVAGNLVNVRSIAAHFRPKIDAWSAAHQIVTITPDQVRGSRRVE